MSSMRNAVQRRNHKERAQPLERQKWGLLEKRKDYSLRAKDFNEKKKRLRILREKASERNPDEFSFAMLNTQTTGGRKVASRGNTALPTDVVKLLKTQDAGYLRTVLATVRKQREKLEQAIVLQDKGGVEIMKRRKGGDANDYDDDDDEDDEFDFGGSGSGGASRSRGSMGKHTVFVADKEEQAAFSAEKWFGVDDEEGEEGLQRTWNRRRRPDESGKKETDNANDNDDGNVSNDDWEDEDDEAMDMDFNSNKRPTNNTKKDTTTTTSSSSSATAKYRADRDLRRKREKAQAVLRAQLDLLRKREDTLMQAERELELQRAKMSNSIGGVNKNGIKFKVRERKR